MIRVTPSPLKEHNFITPKSVKTASGPITPSTPEKMNAVRDKVLIEPHKTPEKKSKTAAFKSPDRPHFSDYFDENINNTKPNKKLKKTIKSLEGKAAHHLVVGSAKKDMELIRKRKLAPDEEGKIHLMDKKRVYKVHNSAQKSIRLIPESGPNIFTFTGPNLRECFEDYLRSDSSNFETHVVEKFTSSYPR